MAGNSEALLRAILSVTARLAFPPDKLAEIVLPKGAGISQLRAFNLCDGTRGQSEIAKVLKLDKGNFSRTLSRWIAEGVVFRIGDGREAKLLHIYSLPESVAKNGADK